MHVSQWAEKRLSDPSGQDISWPSAQTRPSFLSFLHSGCQERSAQRGGSWEMFPRGSRCLVTKDRGLKGETQEDRWGSHKEECFGNQRCLIVEGATSYGSEPPPSSSRGRGPPSHGIRGASPVWCSHGLANAPPIPSTLRFCRGSRASWETSLPGNAFALDPWKLFNPFFP